MPATVHAIKSQPRSEEFWDEELETLPRQELDALQLGLLREHLEFAARNSPYYRQSFREAGVTANETTSLADLRRLPFVNKQTLRERQTAAPLLGDLLAVDELEVVYV